jgi:hypothetical protein
MLPQKVKGFSTFQVKEKVSIDKVWNGKEKQRGEKVMEGDWKQRRKSGKKEEGSSRE